jgi:predicted Ser/Thr protein kinase
MLNSKKTLILTEIELFCRKNDLSYIEGVVFWCEKNNVDVEYVASIAKKDKLFRSKLKNEAENLNILKKSAKLPI